MLPYSYQVLLVGDIPMDAFAGLNLAESSSEIPLEFLQVPSYQTAIQFVQYGRWDAVLVNQNFDSHSGLEFIHHARLLNTGAPLILVCDQYDDSLDYKARKIGAADTVSFCWVNCSYLHTLLHQREKPAGCNKKRPNNIPAQVAMPG